MSVSFHFLPFLTEESTWRMRCPLTFPPQPSYESFLLSHAASENAAEGFATWLMESGGSADDEKQRRWHAFVNLRDWQWKKCFSQWCALTIFDEWATTSWPKQGCNRTAEFQTSPVSKRSDIIICWDAKKYQLSQPSSSSNKFEAEGTLAVRGGIAKFLYINLERAAAVAALPVFPELVSITVHYPLVRSPTEAFPSA